MTKRTNVVYNFSQVIMPPKGPSINDVSSVLPSDLNVAALVNAYIRGHSNSAHAVKGGVGVRPKRALHTF